MQPWRVLFANQPPAIRLRLCLANGQVFGWTHKADGVWTGVFNDCVVRLRQAEDSASSPVLVQAPATVDGALAHFFRMDADLQALCHQWSAACPRFAKLSPHLFGVRLLRQDPVECLFSFIASQNNHISRIASMLMALRTQYGKPLGDGHFAFPTIDSLAAATDEDLRALGFGYRAPYVCSTAQALRDEGGASFLASLKGDAAKARAELLKLAGVGPKVADCVTLFSLECLNIVPVDTHVLQIAKRDYDDSGVLRGVDAVGKKSYDVIVDLFARRFGAQAGWAHTILFTAELKDFRLLVVPADLASEMDAFRQAEQERRRKRAKAS